MTYTVTRLEVDSELGMEVVRGTAQNADTYKSRLGNVTHVLVHDETTAGGAKVSVSGQTVTITCTNSDVIDLLIFGR